MFSDDIRTALRMNAVQFCLKLIVSSLVILECRLSSPRQYRNSGYGSALKTKLRVQSMRKFRNKNYSWLEVTHYNENADKSLHSILDSSICLRLIDFWSIDFSIYVEVFVMNHFHSVVVPLYNNNKNILCFCYLMCFQQ